MKENTSKKGALADYLSFFVLIISLPLIFFVSYYIAEPLFEVRQAIEINQEFESHSVDRLLLNMMRVSPNKKNIAEEIIISTVTHQDTDLQNNINIILLGVVDDKNTIIQVDGKTIVGVQGQKSENIQSSEVILPMPLGSEKETITVQMKK